MGKQEQFFSLTNQADTSIDLLIYGPIPSYDWEEDKIKNSIENFLKEFRILEDKYETINIKINSPGGSVYHGMPIYNAIVNSKANVNTYNDGLAASMAGILLMAGKKRYMAKNSVLMIHNAATGAWGNAKQIEATLNQVKVTDGIIADLFAERSNLTAQEFQDKYLDFQDHFLRAETALENGFIDEIVSTQKNIVDPDIENLSFQEVFNSFDKITTAAKAPFFQSTIDALAQVFLPKPKPTVQPNPIVNMDFSNSKQILAQENLSPEDISAILAEINAFTGATEKFNSQEVTNSVNAAIAPLEARLQEEALKNTTLTNTLSGLNQTLESYRKSGVKPILNASDEPLSETPETVEVISETDHLLAQARKAAGY